jgi:hypothetical protein
MFKNINIPKEQWETAPKKRGRKPRNQDEVSPKRRKSPIKYTKDQMTKMLENYIRIDEIGDVLPMTHIRYITLDSDGRQAFRKGGYVELVTKKLVRLSAGKNKWYVQRYHYDVLNDPSKKTPIFETIFFKKRDQVDDIVDYLETQKGEIEFLKEQINLCRDILQILKEEHEINRSAIDKLKIQVSKCRQMCDKIVNGIH